MKSAIPVLLAALSLASVAAYASDTPASPAPKAAAKKMVAYCAMTGEKIGDPSKSVGTSVYKGKTYYFCCAGCKPEFDKDPAKAAKAADTREAKREADAKKTAPKKS